MSDNHNEILGTDDGGAATAANGRPAEPQLGAQPAETLSELMASGAAPARGVDAGATDIERDALRAAEAAIAEGERALAAARGHLHDRSTATTGAMPASSTAAPAVPSRAREIAVRVLLSINVLAMIVVALLPLPSSGTVVDPASTPSPVATQPQPSPDARTVPAPAPTATKPYNEPWNRALAAAEAGRFADAMTILDQYLADSPAMAPSQQLNVLMALSHYAFRASDFQRAQQYEQRANAIEHSHSLPADLVAMAKAALASGDQETLRRVHARFLLQQRQIPAWLYQHVAQAYLQLGDSYRAQADEAAERARRAELEATTARLREEALRAKEGK